MSQSFQLTTPTAALSLLNRLPSTATPFSLRYRYRYRCQSVHVITSTFHNNNKRFHVITRSSTSSPPDPGTSSSPNGSTTAATTTAAAVVPESSSSSAVVGGIEVDAVTEAELKENGFRSTRRTKLVCTVGPATSGFEQLEALAVGGMNVARINMCHGTREWHRRVIERVRRLNEEKGFAVAIMMDTEGSEIHMGDLGGAPSAKAEVSCFLSHQY